MKTQDRLKTLADDATSGALIRMDPDAIEAVTVDRKQKVVTIVYRVGQDAGKIQCMATSLTPLGKEIVFGEANEEGPRIINPRAN